MKIKNDPSTSENRVLARGFRLSQNFHDSDLIFRDYLRQHHSPATGTLLEERLTRLGAQAAGPMNAFSLNADKHGPVLQKRDAYGETLDHVQFHPDYGRLMDIAVESGMFHLKWDDKLRQQLAGARHSAGFSLGYLYAMAESGQYCPLCMTDGVAYLIDHHASESIRAKWMPLIATQDPKEFVTGAMFLTEKRGGSDVGANMVKAQHLEGRHYALHGEKWFCSNVNAEMIFALARTNDNIPGTRGLSIFLIEPRKADGQRNPLGIVRLKDKLGVRSMASGECLLDGTEGILIGEEFQGFRIMTDMINLSRLYNSVAALSGGRRALIEAWQFLGHRETFGKRTLDHSLVRAKFWELGALHLANFHLVWRAIRALDAAEQGNQDEAEILRVLTPMAKRASAEAAVYLARESMELMGGMGYIEDTVIPKIMRDMMVLPIWEGAGNIMVLDMLRASAKSRGLALMATEIDKLTEGHPMSAPIREGAKAALGGLAALAGLDQDSLEWQAKQHFLSLTRYLQCALIAAEERASGRDQLALEWLMHTGNATHPRQTPPSADALGGLIGWEY